MKIDILSATATEKSKLDVADFFGTEMNEPLVHQVVVGYLANGRQGTKQQKTRSEASGGGRKPWKQKGTGRARAGTIRSPIWRGGGITFAARNDQNHSHRVNKKMYRAAMRVIISELIRSKRLAIVDSLSMETPKTKQLLNVIQSFDMDTKQKLLLVTHEFDSNLFLSSRNLFNVDVVAAKEIDPVSLIKSAKVIMSQEAFKAIEEVLS